MKAPVLTIDGPSGAGKGTVSRAVARQLGWHYLDSGSIYRSLAIASLQNAVDLQDEQAIVRLAEAMVLRFECDNGFKVILNGIDVSAELALEATGNTASKLAVLPEVRRSLLQKQRNYQQLPGLVADGRDMGTVVFSAADYKVYLTASAAERGKRRYKQLIEKGIDANLARITQEIEERDRRDMDRETAPLAVPEQALYLDSSAMSIERVIAEVMSFIQ